MKPPICCVCAADDGPTFELVTFADYEPLPSGMTGHPRGMEWVCGRHLGAARALTHLPVKEAVRKIREDRS